MTHDAVQAALPGQPPPGMLCPDCAREIPAQATGCFSLLRRKPTLQQAYEAAMADRPEALRKHMDPTKNAFRHGTMNDGTGVRPCHYAHLSSWFLAQCRTPDDVNAWLERLAPWWPPPASPNRS